MHTAQGRLDGALGPVVTEISRRVVPGIEIQRIVEAERAPRRVQIEGPVDTGGQTRRRRGFRLFLSGHGRRRGERQQHRGGNLASLVERHHDGAPPLIVSLALRCFASSIERMKNGYSGTLMSSATMACTTVLGSPPHTAHRQ